MWCCSSVEAAPERKRDKKATVSNLILKDVAKFKERYESGPPIFERSPDLTQVRHADTQASYVCRKIRKDQAPCRKPRIIESHVERLSGLEHPHICKLVEAFEDMTSLYLVYEKADPTTLFSYIQARPSFGEDDAAEYTRQAMMALSTAHQQGIVHGQLSPSSVILSQLDDEDEQYLEDEEG